MKKATIIGGIAVLCVVLILGGIGVALWKDTAQPAPTDEHVHFDDPRTADPETAATAVMTGLLTWTPAEQVGPWEAAAAISSQLTGTLAEYASSSDGGGEPLPKNWEAWAASGDRVRGFAVISPENTSTGAQSDTTTITVDVEQRVWHPDGDMTPLTKGTVEVTVELVDGVWKASHYSYITLDY